MAVHPARPDLGGGPVPRLGEAADPVAPALLVPDDLSEESLVAPQLPPVLGHAVHLFLAPLEGRLEATHGAHDHAAVDAPGPYLLVLARRVVEGRGQLVGALAVHVPGHGGLGPVLVVRVGAGGRRGEAVLGGGDDDALLRGRDREVGRVRVGGVDEIVPGLLVPLVGLAVQLVEALDEHRGRQLEPDVVRVDHQGEVIVVGVLGVRQQLFDDREQALELGDVGAPEVPVRPVEVAVPVEQRRQRVAHGDARHDGLAEVDVGPVGGHEDAQPTVSGGLRLLAPVIALVVGGGEVREDLVRDERLLWRKRRGIRRRERGLDKRGGSGR